jgi:hypothetical protein
LRTLVTALEDGILKITARREGTPEVAPGGEQPGKKKTARKAAATPRAARRPRT